jgi:KipI family sensor histidine kinase inhibitor
VAHAPAPEVAWASERCLRVAWSAHAGDEALSAVQAALEAVRRAAVPALVDAVPAYAALLLVFDPRSLDPAAAELRVREVVRGAPTPSEPADGRLVDVPVCYGVECAPDLDDVARHGALGREEAVRLHSGAAYRVAFLGFSPGFPYLTGLPRALAAPRLSRPRLRVPAGSVGIAGTQTGVYPQATPGGWRLVGRTPLVLFAPEREVPALLSPGDRVRFVRITHQEFDARASEHA